MTTKYRWLIGATSAAALCSGLAVATALGAFAGPRAVRAFAGEQTPQFASVGTGVATVDAVQAEAFPAFQRAARPEDAGATDPSLLHGLARAQQQFDVNPSLGRAVFADASSLLYIYPGRGVVCLGAISSTYGTTVGCNSTSAVLAQGLGSQITVGAASFIQGVLPAGAHDVAIIDSSGARTPVTLTSDGGYALQLAGGGTLLTYVDRNGTPHQQELH